jgi:uncharacterized membrane protein YdbT with pleckstrin-like domain
MSRIADELQRGEVIEYLGNPSWWVYFWWFFFALLTSVTVVIPIILIITASILRHSREYMVTNWRIVEKSGVIAENIKSAPFSHITSVDVKQSITGRILNIGDVLIDTSGSGIAIDFTWKSVKDPMRVKDLIEAHIPHSN